MLHHLRGFTLPPLAVAGISLTMGLISGCGQRSTEAEVTRRDITARLVVEGEVIAPATARADIMPPYEVPVEQVYVTVGQNVRQGETLLLFSAPRNQAYYEQARARLVQARQALAQAQNRFSRQLQAAQQRLARSREAERAARTAQAAPPSATPSPEGGGAAPSSPTPAANSARIGSLIARRQADEQAVIDAQARMEEGLVPYQQALAAAQQDFASAQAGSKSAQVKSPITGTVLEVNAEMGKTPDLDDDDPLITVVNLDALHVAAGIHQDQLRQIRPGDVAEVTLEDLPNVRFEGTVDQVYTEKAGFLRGQRYVAIIDFRNTEGRAKPDMDATVRIVTGRARDVLAVPASAVYTVGDRHAVRLKRDGRWRERLVEIGLTDGRYTEIISGLREGDIVEANPWSVM